MSAAAVILQPRKFTAGGTWRSTTGKRESGCSAFTGEEVYGRQHMAKYAGESEGGCSDFTAGEVYGRRHMAGYIKRE